MKYGKSWMKKSDGIGKFFWDPLGLCLQCFFMRDGALHSRINCEVHCKPVYPELTLVIKTENFSRVIQ